MKTQQTPANPTESLIRLPAVLSRVGLKQSRLYELIKSDEFPSPVRLTGGRAVAWRESEVSAWIASRPSARPVAGGES
ncbi:MAG: hypothetical protein B7Y40_06000 [Gammaproteobacteria bacterium 28-57-27]|nr:MAG: hypothetical protein B7Y40_06000 [Gammaproteobacteria bacterium 28-57-27]